MDNKKYRPGESVPMSCNYRKCDKNGNCKNDLMYLKKGETFPPTQHDGGYYVMDMD